VHLFTDGVIVRLCRRSRPAAELDVAMVIQQAASCTERPEADIAITEPDALLFGTRQVTESVRMPKIVSLNVQHGGGKRQSLLAQWLIATEGDFLVLPEWRTDSITLRDELGSAGYKISSAVRAARNANGVGVFLKSTYSATRVTPEDSLKGELLRVTTDQQVIVGAYFPQQQAKAAFFERCGFLSTNEKLPLLILGDLNTGSNACDIEPGATPFHCEKDFFDLSVKHDLSELWRMQHGPDARDWTWRSSRNGFRIDHAFANRAWLSAFPDWQCVYDHSPREQKLTDHSALVIDF
jgi:exodeoxyribonuclease-3